MRLLKHSYLHIYVIKLISIKYSISDLYRNDPGSGKSLQRASNLQQGKFKLICMPKLYGISRYTNQFRIQINVYNYHLTLNAKQIQPYKPQVLRFPNKFYKLLKSKFMLLKSFCFISYVPKCEFRHFLSLPPIYFLKVKWKQLFITAV